MITVSRFSRDGFVPKKQDLLLDIFNFYLNPRDMLLYEKVANYVDAPEDYYENEYFKNLATIRLPDYELGTWVFLELPENIDEQYVSGQLNHLTIEERSKRKWWTATLPEDTICFYPNPNPRNHTVGSLDNGAAYIPGKACHNFINVEELIWKI